MVSRSQRTVLSPTIKKWIAYYKTQVPDLDGSQNSLVELFHYLREMDPRITYDDVVRWVKAHRWITAMNTTAIEITNVEGGAQMGNGIVIEENQHLDPPDIQQQYVIYGMDNGDEGAIIVELEGHPENLDTSSVAAMNGGVRRQEGDDSTNRNQINGFLRGEQGPPPENRAIDTAPLTFQQNHLCPPNAPPQQPNLPHYSNQPSPISDSGLSGTGSESQSVPKMPRAQTPTDQQALKGCFLRLKRLQNYTRRFHRYHCLKKMQRKGINLLTKTHGFARKESEYSAARRQMKLERFLF